MTRTSRRITIPPHIHTVPSPTEMAKWLTLTRQMWTWNEHISVKKGEKKRNMKDIISCQVQRSKKKDQ